MADKMIRSEVWLKCFRTWQILFATLLICFCFTSIGSSQESELVDDLPELISTVEDLQGLTRAEAAKQIPVRIEGVVHAYNPVHDSFFLHQGESPVYVIFPDTRRLRTGQRVVVQGRSLDGFMNNMIVATAVDVLAEDVDLVEPIDLKIKDVLAKSYDCEWVHLENVYIASAAVEAERITFICEQYGSPLHLCIYGSLHEGELAKMIGAKVSVTGNLGVFSVGGELKGIALNSGLSFIKLTSSAEEVLKLVSHSQVGAIWIDKSKKAFRTRGVVNYVDEFGAFIEDSSGGTWLQFERPVPFLEPGFTVNVTGCREDKNGNVDLRVKVVYVQYKDKLPPLEVTPVSELSEVNESRRVRVRGRLRDVAYNEADQVSELLLENRDARFLVIIPAKLEDQSLNLPTARDLLVTGTLTYAPHGTYAGKDLTFRMYSPSFQEVEVWSRNGIWRNRGVQAGGLAGVLVLAGCLLWGHRNRLADMRKGRRLEGLSAQMRSSYDAIRDGIVVVDISGQIVELNQKAREFFSLANGDGSMAEFHRALSAGVKNADFIHLWESLNADFESTNETVFELACPQRRILEVFTSPVDDGSGEATERIWVFYDVTERWRLQDSLMHAQKQEAVGRLAGGIAHDFNNYLTGITGNLFIAKLHPTKTVSEVSESLDAAQSAASRAAALVTNLLGFSQKTPLNMRQVCVNNVIRKMEMLLRPSIPTSISLQFELQDDLPKVHADPLQLEQVLLNICLNARDSIHANLKGMPEQASAIRDESVPPVGRDASNGPVGNIVVRTAATRIDGELKVRVSVADDGCGISQQHLDKIFEPFFTTKGANGTGLGLAMSHGIIKQHSGEIFAESKLGDGSEFVIILPTATIESDESAPHSKEQQPPSVRGRHVLVVDDESSIRSLVSKVLTAEKMVVHTAANGEDAIQQLLQNPNRVELVILDWKMPVRDGKQTLRWLKQELPDLPVLICSGHIFELAEALKKTAHPPELVLQKPFRIQELIAKVHLAFAEVTSSSMIPAGNLQSDESAAGRASAESL